MEVKEASAAEVGETAGGCSCGGMNLRRSECAPYRAGALDHALYRALGHRASAGGAALRAWMAEGDRCACEVEPFCARMISGLYTPGDPYARWPRKTAAQLAEALHELCFRPGAAISAAMLVGESADVSAENTQAQRDMLLQRACLVGDERLVEFAQSLGAKSFGYALICAAEAASAPLVARMIGVLDKTDRERLDKADREPFASCMFAIDAMCATHAPETLVRQMIGYASKYGCAPDHETTKFAASKRACDGMMLYGNGDEARRLCSFTARCNLPYMVLGGRPVETLQEAYANDKDLNSALGMACYDRNAEAIWKLVAMGADRNVGLTNAINGGCLEAVGAMIRLGAVDASNAAFYMLSATSRMVDALGIQPKCAVPTLGEVLAQVKSCLQEKPRDCPHAAEDAEVIERAAVLHAVETACDGKLLADMAFTKYGSVERAVSLREIYKHTMSHWHRPTAFPKVSRTWRDRVVRASVTDWWGECLVAAAREGKVAMVDYALWRGAQSSVPMAFAAAVVADCLPTVSRLLERVGRIEPAQVEAAAAAGAARTLGLFARTDCEARICLGADDVLCGLGAHHRSDVRRAARFNGKHHVELPSGMGAVWLRAAAAAAQAGHTDCARICNGLLADHYGQPRGAYTVQAKTAVDLPACAAKAEESAGEMDYGLCAEELNALFEVTKVGFAEARAALDAFKVRRPLAPHTVVLNDLLCRACADGAKDAFFCLLRLGARITQDALTTLRIKTCATC